MWRMPRPSQLQRIATVGKSGKTFSVDFVCQTSARSVSMYYRSLPQASYEALGNLEEGTPRTGYTFLRTQALAIEMPLLKLISSFPRHISFGCKIYGMRLFNPFNTAVPFGDKPLKFHAVCPQNGTAVLKELTCVPDVCACLFLNSVHSKFRTQDYSSGNFAAYPAVGNYRW